MTVTRIPARPRPRGRHRLPTRRRPAISRLLSGALIAPFICFLVAIGPVMPANGGIS